MRRDDHVAAQCNSARPAAVTRLRTIVAADNSASLALLARIGRMSPSLPERGVRDVTVELPAARPGYSPVERAADLWAQGARKFIDQTYLLPWLPQADLTPAVGGYFEFVKRMAEMNRDLTVKLAEVARSHFVRSVSRPRIESVADVVRAGPHK